jgi:hypothetical protein
MGFPPEGAAEGGGAGRDECDLERIARRAVDLPRPHLVQQQFVPAEGKPLRREADGTAFGEGGRQHDQDRPDQDHQGEDRQAADDEGVGKLRDRMPPTHVSASPS